MKKLILSLILSISILAPLEKANAGFFDSDYFEPTILCAALGGGGYLAAGTSGNTLLYAGGGCAVGALVGYMINSHYRDKYASGYQEKFNDYEKAMKEVEVLQAQKAANGEDSQYSLRVQEIIPGKRLPNGDIMAPTIREKLILPAEGLGVGR